MEQTEIASSVAVVETLPDTLSEADSLFEELLGSDPGPTLDELMNLLNFKTISFAKVAKAVLARSECGLGCVNRLILTAAKSGRIAEIWTNVPKTGMDEAKLYDLIDALTREDWRKYSDILVEVGRLFLEQTKGDSMEFNVQTVIEKIPPLRNEAWDLLVAFESPNAEAWAIPQLRKAFDFFRGDEEKQKASWLLERYPSIAADLITHSNREIAIQAARVVLDQEAFNHNAIGQLICWDKFEGTDITERAIRRAFSEADKGDKSAVSSIVLSTFSTEADKVRAADLLLLGSPDIFCLEGIMNEVPSRAEEARQRRRELIEAYEATKTPTQRLIERISKLEDARGTK